jgi:hypothetical protein
VTETPKELAEEAQRGRSERTPWIALSGVTLGVAALVAIVLIVVVVLRFVID